MKISNEVKIGAVTLLTILVFIWLFNFLKGKNYFKKTVSYYSVYNEVGGLAESSVVEVNGYKVGVVQSIDFLDAESGRLLVEFSVNRDFKLPLNTVAEITPVSIIAGMKVQFVYGNGPGTYSPGDTIPGKLSESLLTSFEKEFTPIKEKITDLLNNLDSAINNVNDIMDAGFKKDLSGTLANLNTTTESFSDIIGSKEKELRTTVDNLTAFSQMLSDNTSSFTRTFTNLESVTDTLAAADLYSSITNLKESLEGASLLLQNLNEGKGSAGKIMTDDSLYTNLSGTLASLNSLLADMKTNPKRYVHFSLFGKKSVSSE